ASRREPERRGTRDGRGDRPERLGEDFTVQLRKRRLSAERRRRRFRREQPARTLPRPRRAAGHRAHLPERAPLPRSPGDRQPAARQAHPLSQEHRRRRAPVPGGRDPPAGAVRGDRRFPRPRRASQDPRPRLSLRRPEARGAGPRPCGGAAALAARRACVRPDRGGEGGSRVLAPRDSRQICRHARVRRARPALRLAPGDEDGGARSRREGGRGRAGRSPAAARGGARVPGRMMCLLQLKSVETLYLDRIRALSGVSLSIDRGEILAVLGPNGAGKTTLLRTIAGLLQDQPEKGVIELEGKRIERRSPEDIARMGVVYVPEDRGLFRELTVAENLELGLWGTAGRRGDLEAIYAMFPILAERTRQQSDTLSAGEQQMLALGRALLRKPRLLLLDEPSLGLAPQVARTVFEK